MTCNRCRHNREIARLREICSKCELGDKCASSGTFSLDNMTEGAVDDPRMRARRAAGVRAHASFDPGEIDEPPAPETPERRARDALVSLLASISEIPYERVADLLRLVRAFDGLGREDFELVQHFLNGGTMTSYADAHGLSKQTAWARCKSLFRRRPEFASAANGLLGRGKGGRRARRRPEQLSLFDFKDADRK